jgi:Sporulation inhibitor A.
LDGVINVAATRSTHTTLPETEYPIVHDKMILFRPLTDEHLLEVYHEAVAMGLSAEFIQLIEEAIRSRNLDPNAL